MIRRIIFLSVLGFMSFSVSAAGLDIRLGGDAAQLEYLRDSDSQIGIGGADIGAAVFFNDADDIMLTLGALITGSSAGRNRALQLGAGARLYAASLDLDVAEDPNNQALSILNARDQDEVGAAAIGGKISYIFPASMPMAVTGEIFYAPDIVSFGDNEDLLDIQIRFELELAPTTRFYVGYRNLEVEMEDSGVDYELDDSAHAGVRFSF